MEARVPETVPDIVAYELEIVPLIYPANPPTQAFPLLVSLAETVYPEFTVTEPLGAIECGLGTLQGRGAIFEQTHKSCLDRLDASRIDENSRVAGDVGGHPRARRPASSRGNPPGQIRRGP